MNDFAEHLPLSNRPRGDESAVVGGWARETAAALSELGRMLGALPMGTQLIRLSDEITPDERIVHDTGGPQSGAMRVVRSWHHRLGISAVPGDAGRTRFRDVLTVKAGVLTPIVTVGFWVFWQLRARALRRLAPRWAAQFGVSVA